MHSVDEWLVIDCERETERIAAAIRLHVQRTLHRRGGVIAVSGGVDSAVVASLCAVSLGAARCLALQMPERESSEESTRLGRLLIAQLGVESVCDEISEVLDALGCYEQRAAAVREVIPEFRSDWRFKIALQSVKDSDRYSFFNVVVQTPAGKLITERLSAAAYLQLVASTNFKQRVRKMKEYFHADRLNYAVMGTPNKLEYDQGFFVKGGDGAADIKPIAHLYKTQVYQLAEHLGVPAEIRRNPPSTDTYSLPQTQEEFYFSLPYDQMDICLYGRDHDRPTGETAEHSGLTREQVERVYRDIDAKRRAARYLHSPPLLID